jgi:hypothetical protein
MSAARATATFAYKSLNFTPQHKYLPEQRASSRF